MRKIIVGAQVSMDGVMQAPGGPAEDPTRGFKFGGWAMAYFSKEGREEIDRLFSEKFDLLLGRKTYEIFAAYWPYYDEGAPAGGIAKLFKEIKKYVVSRSGKVDTGWAGSVLLRDIAQVKRMKQEDGPNLVTQGSTELVHALLANDLLDAISTGAGRAWQRENIVRLSDIIAGAFVGSTIGYAAAGIALQVSPRAEFP
jgi:dihydrofolate reductase